MSTLNLIFSEQYRYCGICLLVFAYIAYIEEQVTHRNFYPVEAWEKNAFFLDIV
ncbi:hypothetical protein ABQ286_09990 [Lacticaseibacillus rhamnosus]|uniref:hypothetical protein n=1 Tax=Lacticaseibacillus rhamnosus TaxID=47715 RepID=UPI0001B5E8FD|nr:hypothetical protein [Lacticaseibacillus rhamnosus]MCI9806582.1 hypothetical protein [Lacticaseibacillus rhamnosus]MDE3306755.1 hypothetical protein [Lacticaseibacillus rhamnosus]MDM7525164.1 hypothetical protein [Lacticaseibacillus rhamnosus]MSC24505.1 hypothetical protein [Lacticaseibacillus rhamnosus]WNP43178.1 hypothetical protein RMQ71_04095 [Lacticaseibacillus rhamnosus]